LDVLALDIRHAGLLTDTDILEELRLSYPKVVALGFAAVWLAASTAPRSARIA
jgi:hypothetical protein